MHETKNIIPLDITEFSNYTTIPASSAENENKNLVHPTSSEDTLQNIPTIYLNLAFNIDYK